jgi:putative transposase
MIFSDHSDLYSNFATKLLHTESPIPDNYWHSKIYISKSIRDHYIGVKKSSTKSKTYLGIARPVIKICGKLSNQNKNFQYKLSKTMVENTRANPIK